MKRHFVFTLLMLLSATLFAQSEVRENPKSKPENRDFRIPLIGDMAPAFTAESTQGIINFPDDFGRNWKIIMSHPMDFTPVCSSEILELANMQKKFEKLGVDIIAVSTDLLATHIQWKNALEKIEYNGNPAQKIKFPIVDDASLTISKLYGMIHPETNSTKDVRGVFIIDPDNVIRAEYFYPHDVGRNMDELLRTVVAIQTTDKNHVLTPANWQAGNDVLVPYLPNADMTGMNNLSGDYYQFAWFLRFKKASSSGTSK